MVKLITEEDEEYEEKQIANLVEKVVDKTIDVLEVKLQTFEVKLVDEDDNEVQPDGKVTVKIPCPEDYNPDTSKVYYISDNGNIVDMEATYVDGFLSFVTTHFSTYVITDV